MAGHMGAARATARNLRVVQVDEGRNLLLVSGSVPGSKGGDVLVQPARTKD
jgi:large subunit ribosomal protein L3